jgi:hemerythrin-like metal-binding protein
MASERAVPPSGLTNIHQQHERIAGLLEELRRLVLDGADSARLEPVFTRLVTATQTHFRSEEREFQLRGYPAALDHAQDHDRLIARAFRLRDDFMARSPTAAGDALALISEWTDHHSDGPDQTFLAYLAGPPPP